MKASAIEKFMLLFTALLLSACGGGGGVAGDGAPATTPAGTYTGVAAQATITTANAAELSADAYQNGSIGSTVNIARVTVEAPPPVVRASLFPELGSLLRSGVTRGIQAKAAGRQALSSIVVEDSINGAYGGSAWFSISVDQSTGAVSGTATFSDFREAAGGPAVFGTVNIAGMFDQASGLFSSLDMFFSPLTALTIHGTFNLYGSIALSTAGATETLKVSTTLASSSGMTYWIKDWSYAFSSGNILHITGRYYHPTHGYVEITTPEPLTVSSVVGRPVSGVWHSAGSNGTSARLTFTDQGFTIAADTAGNGQWAPVP